MRQMTAEQLAEQLGIAAESLGHIECGNRRPSLTLLYTISVILDVLRLPNWPEPFSRKPYCS